MKLILKNKEDVQSWLAFAPIDSVMIFKPQLNNILLTLNITIEEALNQTKKDYFTKKLILEGRFDYEE